MRKETLATGFLVATLFTCSALNRVNSQGDPTQTPIIELTLPEGVEIPTVTLVPEAPTKSERQKMIERLFETIEVKKTLVLYRSDNIK